MKTDIKFENEVSITVGKNGHLQGIAYDQKRGHLYWSFTTALVKTDLKGNILASVSGFIGHLGCIAYCAERDELWGSLELKKDAIGEGVSSLLGRDPISKEGFYAVVFDVKSMRSRNMNPETSNVMRACCLIDVFTDYSAKGENGLPHRHGCSGIDGITFAPKITEEDNAPLRMFVAYGIYGDVNRSDNDDQVILSIDPDTAKKTAVCLRQEDPHRIGVRCEEKFFLRTGNTEYGIQNLEYDSFTDSFFAAVYPGKKPEFPNPPMFVFPRKQTPEVIEGNSKRLGEKLDSYDFPLGSTGLASLGNGEFLVSESVQKRTTCNGKISKYKFTGTPPTGFEKE